MPPLAYRMGDSYTNIMTPLMSYFPLILGFARRGDKDFGVGPLLARMLPYALTFMVGSPGRRGMPKEATNLPPSTSADTSRSWDLRTRPSLSVS